MQPGSLKLTITVWRSAAVKKLWTLAEKNHLPLGALMHEFSQQVDQEILDKQIRQLFTERYTKVILESNDYFPSEIKSDVAKFSNSKEYELLVNCLAQWLVLLEMSEDLIDRLHVYGLCEHLNEQHHLKEIQKNSY